MSSRTLGLAAAAGLLIVAVAVYRISFENPFSYDDVYAVERNAFIRDARHLPGFLAGENTSEGFFRGHFRPLPMATFFLNYRAGALDPRGYRAVNLALHLLCAGLVFFVVRRLLLAFPLSAHRDTSPTFPPASTGALLACALFTLHPLNSLEVLLVWKRTTLLATLFFLLAVALYLVLRGIGGRSPPRTASRVLAAVAIVLCHALGLASKETAVTLPVVLVLLELWPRGSAAGPDAERSAGDPAGRARQAGRTWIALAGLVFAPLAALSVLALTVFFPSEISGQAPTGPWPYLLTQAKVIGLYAAMVVRPGLLAAAYDVAISSSPLEPAVLVAGTALLGLAVLAVLLRRRLPLPALAVAWVLVTLSPTSSFVPGPLLIDEDRTYLPFVALWALVGGAAGLALLRGGLSRAVAAGAVLLALVGLLFSTAQRCVTWGDRLWVWLDAVRKYPRAPIAGANLCGILSETPGRAPQAERVCREALALSPRSPRLAGALVEVLAGVGRYREAEVELRRARRISPADPFLLKIAGHLAWVQDRPAEAIPLYLESLRRNPWDHGTAVSLARAYEEAGRPELARRALVQAFPGPVEAEAWADDAQTLLGAAEIEERLGELGRAERRLEALRRAHPDLAAPIVDLARLALRGGRRARARVLLDEAEGQASSEDSFLLARLARGRLELGQAQRAVVLAGRALALAPQNGLAHAVLAAALLGSGRRAQACAAYWGIERRAATSSALREVLAPVEKACDPTLHGGP
jgi:protein O-mannosyl-transferase